ncbi:MAG: NADPH-dependent oxidoreductase [Bacteroidetes bacterium]|nr:MAG: NADPH-dependent oxidoreductase [Bacteroidota bacterium]
MRIAIILGSVRQGRQTDQACRYLLQELRKQEAETRLLDLADYELPIYKESWEEQAQPQQALASFGQALAEADALILASPEYHGSYTGVLKNALDHYWKEFYRKPIGVMATGSGRFGGLNASTHLQQLVLSLGAFPMPFKLLVPYVNEAFDEQDQPLSEALIGNIQRFIEEFLWFARAIVQARQAGSPQP